MNSITNEYILKVAMEQSAKDIGCKMEDFLTSENRVVPFQLGVVVDGYTIGIASNFGTNHAYRVWFRFSNLAGTTIQGRNNQKT